MDNKQTQMRKLVVEDVPSKAIVLTDAQSAIKMNGSDYPKHTVRGETKAITKY